MVPPVPIPNTVVKHPEAESTCLETGWEENLRRNGSRAAVVPEDVIGGMLDRLEPPERWEADRVEWLCT